MTPPLATSSLHRLTTPRAAAVAGVLFAVLFGTALIMIRSVLPEVPRPGTEWVDDRGTRLTVSATLIPFAGIMFLWFIGVVRDGFGHLEDRFFSSVFVGSGLLFLATTFVWSAIGIGLVHSSSVVEDPNARREVVAFAQGVLLALSQTYSLRMAAVFMISLATIWLRTGLMPRWLVGVTYAVAFALLISAEVNMWITLAFPCWVLVVSLLLLVRAGVIPVHRRAGADPVVDEPHF